MGIIHIFKGIPTDFTVLWLSNARGTIILIQLSGLNLGQSCPPQCYNDLQEDCLPDDDGGASHCNIVERNFGQS